MMKLAKSVDDKRGKGPKCQAGAARGERPGRQEEQADYCGVGGNARVQER